MNTKQVIVFRKDLLKGENAIRKGKFAAQVAHASIASMLKTFRKTVCREYESDYEGNIAEDTRKTYRYETEFAEGCVMDEWLNGKFTKVVVSVENDDELKELSRMLDETHIPHALITDCGLTEFHGKPTNTCLGIGPYVSEEIDKYTGNLKLL